MTLFYVTALLVLFLDQGTKLLIQHQMTLFQSVPIIHGILSLTYVLNPGAAFGILRYQTTFLIALTLVVIAVALIYRKEIPQQPVIFRLGLALGFGGAVGNLCDRLRLKAVVDFIELPHYPVFNVADCAIVIGVSLIVIFTVLSEIKSRKTDRGNAE